MLLLGARNPFVSSSFGGVVLLDVALDGVVAVGVVVDREEDEEGGDGNDDAEEGSDCRLDKEGGELASVCIATLLVRGEETGVEVLQGLLAEMIMIGGGVGGCVGNAGVVGRVMRRVCVLVHGVDGSWGG